MILDLLVVGLLVERRGAIRLLTLLPITLALDLNWGGIQEPTYYFHDLSRNLRHFFTQNADLPFPGEQAP